MIYAVAPNASIDASVQFRAHVGAIFSCKNNFGSIVCGKIKKIWALIALPTKPSETRGTISNHVKV